MSGGGPPKRLLAVFLQEARERASAMERDLLLIEQSEDQVEREKLVQNILRSAHSLKGAARLVDLGELESACHWMEELLTRSQAGAVPLDRRNVELLLEATDAIAGAIPELEQGNRPSADRLDSICTRLAQASGEAGGTTPEQGIAGGTGQRQPSGRARPLASHPTASQPDEPALDPFVRVPAERLDSMLAQSGELLLARTAVSTRAEQLLKVHRLYRRSRSGLRPDLRRELDLELRLLVAGMTVDQRKLKRISAELDSQIRSARLQPFSRVCEGLDRLVRDLASASGKQVRLQVEGGDVEVDRSILEELRTAVRHIVRNAVDHGIEPPAERVAAGKSAEGRIVIAAALQQDRIAVEISDDGRGLAADLIRGSAAESRLGEGLADEEVERLIFLPGISTASATTRISGRGVGLDAVRKCVESMRGAVEVDCADRPGTMFTITVPLTIGSMRALLLRCGGQLLALDSTAVRRVFRFSSDMISTTGAGKLVVKADKTLPLVRLADWLQIPSDSGESGRQLVGVELTEVGRGVAIEIGEIVAEQEFLIRSLGRRLANLSNFSGAIVMPDGAIAMVLNAASAGSAAISGVTRASIRGQAKARNKPHRILIVDDSITTRTLEKTILEGAGYEVSVAADGLEALHLLEEEGADLILADVDMPGIDGFMLTEKVRQSAKLRDLPLILLTAREAAEDRDRGLRLGADAYLVKSAFDQRELLSTIGQLL
jgi:two-component system chemotaxis sensor kinase CheA